MVKLHANRQQSGFEISGGPVARDHQIFSRTTMTMVAVVRQATKIFQHKIVWKK